MEFVVERVTHGPKHHLFGFHDLVQCNAAGDLLLSLEVDDISRPPLPGDTCSSGVVDLRDGTHAFRRVHLTHTWNYPQGARQQWIGESDLFVCNDREEDGRLVSLISDARKGVVVKQLPFPVHCLNAETGSAVYINYDRLHSVGGYGYVPHKVIGNPRLADLPDDDGLWVGNMSTGEVKLIASIRQVAACGEVRPVQTGFPHYLTHPMLNPSGTRIAFLHEYRVPDGGDISRMIVCDWDGGNMRCLAKGLVSHFTWIDDQTIFAWGGDERGACRLRESPLLRVPGALPLAKLAKRAVRIARSIKTRRANSFAGKQKSQFRAFMLLADEPNVPIRKSGVGILTQDGHPMARPGDWAEIVCDTYPNSQGDRQLYFYNTRSEQCEEVGRFRRIFQEPDLSAFDWRMCQTGVDPRIIRAFDRRHYMFARSGLHCDLHPRWSFDGKVCYFDSIHEGTRQIYAVNYSR